MILSLNGIIAGKGADADAQAFITAAGITDSTQKSAITQLVTDLKSANIWSKMKAIYPFVGGTASSHRFNLKAPTTNASDFYLIPYGGITHSSNGVQFDGTSGYFDTQLNENTTMTLGDEHISFYSRTNTQGLFVDIGTWDSTTGGSQIISRASYLGSDSFLGYVTDANSSYVVNATSWGFYMANRTSTSQLKLQINSAITTFTNNASSKVNRTFWIGARNINTSSYLFTTRQCAFATLGNSLNNTEATALYNAIQTYQTTLNRQVI